ncbi:hypothetical protein M404DRAFT_502048 [Pisolithus tinctorius Marx 270]|uniref:Uncharacterized protein n=1 Tax=Pisolithus tinctorius Marx 270 TaxID=870435 RepID=A0A0C3J732_PISTI|nr:hypothetical protein M404DRAFT_502048 [Pisolithus tinctorius Marx 270]
MYCAHCTLNCCQRYPRINRATIHRQIIGVDSGIWPGHLHRQPILPYPKLVIPIPIVTIHSSECWSCLFSHPGGYMRNSMAWSKPGTTYMASAVTSARTLPYKPTRTRKFGSMANLQSSMCLVPGGEAELQVSRL